MLFIAANVFVYKIKIEKEANQNMEETSIPDTTKNILDKLEEKYVIVFVSVIVITILTVLFFFIQKNAF